MRAILAVRVWVGVTACVAAGACTRSNSGDVELDSSVASVAKTAGAAEVSAGLFAQYPPRDSAITWTFDSMPAGQPPNGFSFGRTGGSPRGRWIIQAADDAPSRPNVLVHIDTVATSDRFPVAVADAPSLRDLELAVRCKPISGRVDQACGLVFRYRDENNYYMTRANALEGNVRLYYVKNGRRREIASWRGAVTRGEWHELGADARGEQLDVRWDGQRIISKRDETFRDAGRVGVWLKADSYTMFDNLRVIPR